MLLDMIVIIAEMCLTVFEIVAILKIYFFFKKNWGCTEDIESDPYFSLC